MQKKLSQLFGDNPDLEKKFVDIFIRALEKHNKPGFDYIQFKQSMGALAEMGMDESTAIRSAFVTASTVGLTKSKLLESASFYAQVINAEKEHFDAALAKRINQKVGGKMKEVEKLKEQIIKYKEKIQQLQNQIEKHQHTIDTADEQIQAEKQKILGTQNNFEKTHTTFIEQIKSDIDSFKTFL
jgi:septal ring factor EnvC (AmiA/AmiB activator)